MNHYAARQRKSDMRWEFTCRNDENTWSVGYCAGGKVWSQVKGEHREKWHDDGHPTAEDAAECYRQFQLDQYLRFEDNPNATALGVCEHPECSEAASGIARVGMISMRLCSAHKTRETVDTLFRRTKESWSSY